ncbi:RHS repeat-associated core domain-containing protein, partial [Xenorhabdus khoisanae]|uniref:RHS repeat domain-containing protein n=1 Tax=Xenorhabdus khoisanae TaxID=880157 RepID=UPI0032B80940
QYKYDPFGRRIRKLKVQDGKLTAANLQLWLAGKPDLLVKADSIVGHDYLWSGNQLIEEMPVYADGAPVEDQRIRWLYKPDSLTPSARFERGKLHYIVSDHQGTPREMLDEQGVLVWAQRLKTWGQVDSFKVIGSNHPDYHVNCNLRFLGQYFDEESGFYYNRHRYYSPETGQYISSDPIGLLGGLNPYGYVHNPVGWVDALGLSGTSGTQSAATYPLANGLSAKEIAETQVSELLAGATSKTKQRNLPTALSVGVDSTTGKVYSAVSGWPRPKIIHQDLIQRMPPTSLEPWAIENCAEFKVVNLARFDGANIKNLEVHTMRVREFEAYPRCANCRITTAGIKATSD